MTRSLEFCSSYSLQLAEHAVVEDLERQRVLQTEQQAVGAQVVEAGDDAVAALELADLDGVAGLVVALAQVDERAVRAADADRDGDLGQHLVDGRLQLAGQADDLVAVALAGLHEDDDGVAARRAR